MEPKKYDVYENQSEENEVGNNKENKEGENERIEINEIEQKIIEAIKSINEKIFKLISDNNDLLYNIKDKISKISQKENQIFSICGIIAGEIDNYFRGKNIYEKELKDLLKRYIFIVNTAKQKLDSAKFFESYNDIVNKIENSNPEKPKLNNSSKIFKRSY